MVGHDNHMKVNSAEFKMRLGYYLRTVEQSGETLQVCIRDRVVACLVPSSQQSNRSGRVALVQALEKAGLKVTLKRDLAQPLELPEPSLAGDGRDDLHSVEMMRTERDW